MALTNFKYGLSSFGVPLPAGAPATMNSGKVFFVDSGSGSNDNTGSDTTHAVSTLAKAVALCTANNGDVIYVMEGHAENLTTAVTPIAGSQIIGLGTGRNRPVFTYTGTGGNITVSAASVRISNCCFVAGIANVVAAVTVTGADCTIDGCEFSHGATTAYCFLQSIDAGHSTTATPSRLRVQNCQFWAEQSKVAAYNGIAITQAAKTVIVNNIFDGNFATACIYSRGTVSAGILVANNYARNDDATAGKPLNLSVNDTGIIAWNVFVSAHTGTAEMIVPGQCGRVMNFGCKDATAPTASTWTQLGMVS